jgi:hypothetical protein
MNAKANIDGAARTTSGPPRAAAAVLLDMAIKSFFKDRCSRCWDSHVARDMYGRPDRCGFCLMAKMPITAAAQKILNCVLARIEAGRTIDPLTLDAARMLSRSSLEDPVMGAVLAAHLNRDARQVKQLMRTLRDDWLLPVSASREEPYGYYIAASLEELSAWARTSRAQAISTLATIYRLLKANMPALAGQQELDFIQQVSSELEEAIK